MTFLINNHPNSVKCAAKSDAHLPQWRALPSGYINFKACLMVSSTLRLGLPESSFLSTFCDA